MGPDWLKTLARGITSGEVVRPVILVVAVGSFLAVIGPFDSHTVPWPQIWFYWVGLIALGGVFGFGGGAVLPRLFPQLEGWPVYALVAAFVSIPVTVAILWMEGALSAQLTVGDVALTYPPVFLISAFVSAVAYAVDRIRQNRADLDANGSPGAVRPAAALIDKLPARLRQADILSLCAEDHYLRVRTQAGEALILMRLSDAAAACQELDGARTHRSWWVARAAVSEARKGDGRAVLVLQDGTEAPVSRTNYPALREAGWF